MASTDNKKAVFVVNRHIHHMGSGSAVYLRACIDAALAEGLEAHIVMAPVTAAASRPMNRVHDDFSSRAQIHWPQTLRRGDKYFSTSPTVWGRFIQRLGQAVMQRLGMDPGIKSLLGVAPGKAEQARIVAAVKAIGPDVVIVEYSSMGPVLEDLKEVPMRAVFLHDLFSHRAETFRKSGAKLDHVDISFEDEMVRMRAANGFIYASVNEMEAVRAAYPEAGHFWLRPVVTVRPDALVERAPFIAYIGARHAGSVDALVHFMDEIWPRIRSKKPDAALKIAGDVGPACAQAQNQPGVEILGRVDDLADLAGPDVVGVAPTRLASGVSIKVAEYLALGMPVVAYPMGLDGFGDLLDGAVLRAETAEAYAKAVVDLLENAALRRDLSRRALSVAADTLSDPGIRDIFHAPKVETEAAPAAPAPLRSVS